MEKEIYYISLGIYSLIFVLCICFQFNSYLKYKRIVKKNNAVSLMDTLYETGIYIVGFLYLAMYISGIVDVFFNTSKYDNWKIPFIISAMPLMVITFKILVSEGLYAYSCNKLLIGSKKSFGWENVKINKIYKNSYVNRVKIIVTIDNATIINDKKYVIRTSLNSLQLFEKTYKRCIYNK